MKIQLDRLRGSRLVEDRRIDADSPLVAGLEARIDEPLIVELEVVNPWPGTYLLDATVTGTLQANCRRCVAPTEVEVDERFRIVYRESEAGERDASDPDLVPIERGTGEIDVGPEIRDRLFVEVERYPLCREDCAGLCPLCGIDRNEATCDCTTERIDSRWSALEAVRLDES